MFTLLQEMNIFLSWEALKILWQRITMFSNVVYCSRRKNEFLWSKGLIMVINKSVYLLKTYFFSNETREKVVNHVWEWHDFISDGTKIHRRFVEWVQCFMSAWFCVSPSSYNGSKEWSMVKIVSDQTYCSVMIYLYSHIIFGALKICCFILKYFYSLKHFTFEQIL